MGVDFLTPLIIGLAIQVIKIFIDLIDEKEFKVQNLWRAGGFPSVHSGISSSIATLMLLKYGIDSAEFSIAFIFAFLFWYDAMSVRYEAGKHAEYLNRISNELKSILDYQESRGSLKERLGHTFLEVIGGIIIGSLLTVSYFFLFIK